MKFLVIGAGSIGKRHTRNLLAIGVLPSQIGIVEVRKDRIEEVKKTLNIAEVYASIEEALDKQSFDAAIVCAPTSLHIPIGTQLASRGIHILMEKPLAHNLEGIEEFQQAVEKNNVVVEMAYIFRYAPAVQKLKELLEAKAVGKVLSVRGEFSEYLPDWHPWEDYRSFYMARKSQGGGSILDQSHIMDLVHYLLGGFESVFAVNTRLSDLEIEADDFAEMIVTLKNGVVASIHTDIFGRDHKKHLEMKGETGNLYWDHYANEVRHYDALTKCVHVYKKFPADFNLNYIVELSRFIACCKGEEKPLADLQTGIETMELILAAERSQQTKRVEKVGAVTPALREVEPIRG
jgi:predicted dehydrogenase